MNKFKKTIMVSSGKGGTGKTLTSANIGIKLSEKGYKIGILDADTRSPNLTYILGITEKKFKHTDDSYRKLIPIEHNGFKVFSTATLFPDLRGITIPGEQQRNFLRQAIYDVDWGKLDYLIVDMDPSSGDTLLTMREVFKKLQAVVVCTADISSLNDCSRIIHACIIHNIQIVGVVANMISSECPNCHELIICKKCGWTVSFGDEAKVVEIANKYHVHYLGGIRWNPDIKSRNNAGNPLLPDMKIIDDIVRRIL